MSESHEGFRSPRDEFGDRPPDSERSSLPWQERAKYRSALSAMAETIRVVLFSPSQAFSFLRLGDSISGSLIFVTVLGSTGTFILNMWQFLFQAYNLTTFSGTSSPHGQMMHSVGVAGSIIITAFLSPILIIVASFVSAGILHLCLMMTGGANRTFEATYAAVAYSWGATALFLVFPLCGGWIAGIWRLIVEIFGLAAAHRTDVWRALVAELLPLVFCCGAAGVLIWLLILPGLAGAYGA